MKKTIVSLITCMVKNYLNTNFRMDESFRDILEDMNTNTVFRFYNFHDIKG